MSINIMSIESSAMRDVEELKDIYIQAVAWSDRPMMDAVLSKLRDMGFSTEARELLMKTKIKDLLIPTPFNWEDEDPTQEDINGGFTGINSGNND